MRKAIVLALTENGERLQCNIEFTDAEPHHISARIEGVFDHHKPCIDAFDGLIAIREKLFAKGIKLLCAGARKDVYPSRMSRQMGGGVTAYRMTMGNVAQRSDIVRIFDPAKVEEIGTVAEQLDYFRKWLSSIS